MGLGLFLFIASYSTGCAISIMVILMETRVESKKQVKFLILRSIFWPIFIMFDLVIWFNGLEGDKDA